MLEVITAGRGLVVVIGWINATLPTVLSYSTIDGLSVEFLAETEETGGLGLECRIEYLAGARGTFSWESDLYLSAVICIVSRRNVK
jgi:hypothetical protein